MPATANASSTAKDKPFIRSQRRIVTGHDAEGNSVFIADGMAPVLPPESERNFEAVKDVFNQWGEGHVLTRKNRHPVFHKTTSVDYAIVLEDEVWALMDIGETLMKPGDVLVQRGTNHAWSNRSDKQESRRPQPFLLTLHT